jgi:chromosomal replication initiation ATPase DnaA
MLTVEELQAHYAAVRARLNAGPPPKPTPKPVVVFEPAVQLVLLPETKLDTLTDPYPITRIQKLLKEIADKHNMTVLDIKGASRKNKPMLARREACYRLRTELNMSFTKIGWAVGYRDHTTVLNAVRRYEKLTLKTD